MKTWTLPRWPAWIEAFDARLLRERVLLIVALCAGLALVVDSLWLGPALKDWRLARQQLLQTRDAVDRLRQDGETLAQRGQVERRQLEAELQRLRARYGELSAPAARRPAAGPDVRRSAGGLVPASEMLPLLGQLLKRQPGIKVLQLASLGHSAIGAAPAAAGASAPGPARGGARIYRHGVELVLQGSYADLVGYLQAVEALPQGLLWGSLRLNVEEYPRLQMTVRLYTLSLDARWLEI